MRHNSSYVITPTLLTILYIQVCTFEQYQDKTYLYREVNPYIYIYIYIYKLVTWLWYESHWLFPYGNKHNVCKLCSHARHDLHHSVIVITYLQSIVTAIHEYETSPIIKNNFKNANNSYILYMVNCKSQLVRHTLFVMVNETTIHIVWWVVGLPSWLSARMQMSYEKMFFLQKEAGQLYNFWGVANFYETYTLILCWIAF